MENYLVRVKFVMNEVHLEENFQINEAKDATEASEYTVGIIKERGGTDISVVGATPVPPFDKYSWNTATFSALGAVDQAFYLDDEQKRKMKEDISANFKPV